MFPANTMAYDTGEPPVIVILNSSNLNVHEDGVIQWGAARA
jgi:hypothetical protein